MRSNVLRVPEKSGWPNIAPFSSGIFGLMFWSLCLALFVAPVSHAQTDLQVDVQVANQSDSERNGAYWLAFDRVLRREVETRIRVEPLQREELLAEPSRFVQSFRYRRYNPTTDNFNLATRRVREGAAPAAVISVAFPNDLAAIIQQQLIPVVEEQEAPVLAPVITLVAVEQEPGSQILIGGERGRNFQARAMQLAAANNLQIQFPEILPETDLSAPAVQITAADVFTGNAEQINAYVQQFESTELLTGALFRISPTTWQSEWNFTSQTQQPQSFGLTTATLDEALVAAMRQISPDSIALSSTYNDGSEGSQQSSGVAIRIENIRSLADYDNVITVLRRLDPGALTESLELDSMVFRATEQSAVQVRDSLIASRNFEPLNIDQFADELLFRYQTQ